jgi:hypothetical protein
MFKVRFNLGAGKNFMKWKVTSKNKVFYLDPNEVTLNMYQCKLKNQKATAQKIHEGNHKTVCAWIQCEQIKIEKVKSSSENLIKISYNPKIVPYWNDCGNNADNKEYNLLVTSGRSVFRINWID